MPYQDYWEQFQERITTSQNFEFLHENPPNGNHCRVDFIGTNGDVILHPLFNPTQDFPNLRQDDRFHIGVNMEDTSDNQVHQTIFDNIRRIIQDEDATNLNEFEWCAIPGNTERHKIYIGKPIHLDPRDIPMDQDVQKFIDWHLEKIKFLKNLFLEE